MRASNGKKLPIHSRAQELRAVFDDVSKAAMMDVIGDLLDQIHGEGEWRVADAVEDAAPALLARGDREPENLESVAPEAPPRHRGHTMTTAPERAREEKR